MVGEETTAGSVEKTRVSVALGTYNSTNYVVEQLDSILSQSFLPYEIVISDDGSTDATISILEDYIARNTSSTIIRIAASSRAGGVSRNFERAILACEGDVIALSDHDDLWHRDKLKVIVELFASDPSAVMVFSDALLVDENGESRERLLFDAYEVGQEELGRLPSPEAIDVLARRNIVTGATAAIRADFAKAAMPVGPFWIHDEWLATLAAAVDGLRVIQAPLTYYRIHGHNQIGIPQGHAVSRFFRDLKAPNARYTAHEQREFALLRKANEFPLSPHARDVLYDKLAFEHERARYGALPILRYRGIRRSNGPSAYRRFALNPQREYWSDVLRP